MSVPPLLTVPVNPAAVTAPPEIVASVLYGHPCAAVTTFHEPSKRFTPPDLVEAWCTGGDLRASCLTAFRGAASGRAPETDLFVLPMVPPVAPACARRSMAGADRRGSGGDPLPDAISDCVSTPNDKIAAKVTATLFKTSTGVVERGMPPSKVFNSRQSPEAVSARRHKRPANFPALGARASRGELACGIGRHFLTAPGAASAKPIPTGRMAVTALTPASAAAPKRRGAMSRNRSTRLPALAISRMSPREAMGPNWVHRLFGCQGVHRLYIGKCLMLLRWKGGRVV